MSSYVVKRKYLPADWRETNIGARQIRAFGIVLTVGRCTIACKNRQWHVTFGGRSYAFVHLDRAIKCAENLSKR